MTEHSILFQPNMVKALRDGTKTQTRRQVAAHNTTFDSGPWPEKNLDLFGAWIDESFPASPILKVPMGYASDQTIHRLRPRVEVGDSLWVKEAHWALGHWQEKGELKKNGQPKMKFVQNLAEPVRFVEPDHALRFPRDTTFGWYPRNSLFMRRKDCRLVMPVTDIRFQRLQDISEADAIAEGVEFIEAFGFHSFKDYGDQGNELHQKWFGYPRDSFESLITSINGPEAWDENMPMLAYSFEVPA